MAVTADKLPGTLASVDDPAVTGDVAWTNPTNAGSSNNTYATVAVTKDTTTQFLQATNFGIAAGDIPAGSTIDNIEIVVERKYGYSGTGVGETCRDNKVYLRKTAGQVGPNMASGSTWPTSDTDTTYTWTAAQHTLTYSDIVGNADFGVDFEAYLDRTDETVTAYVDRIKVRVYYTLPPPGAVRVLGPNVWTGGKALIREANL